MPWTDLQSNIVYTHPPSTQHTMNNIVHQSTAYHTAIPPLLKRRKLSISNDKQTKSVYNINNNNWNVNNNKITNNNNNKPITKNIQIGVECENNGQKSNSSSTLWTFTPQIPPLPTLISNDKMVQNTDNILKINQLKHSKKQLQFKVNKLSSNIKKIKKKSKNKKTVNNLVIKKPVKLK